MIIIILQYFLENIIAKMKRWGAHMLLKFVPSDSSIDIAGCQLCQVHCQMRKGGIIKWRIASCLSPLLSYKHKWIWKLASFMTDLMFSLKYIIFDLVYFRRCIAMMNFNSIHTCNFVFSTTRSCADIWCWWPGEDDLCWTICTWTRSPPYLYSF